MKCLYHVTRSADRSTRAWAGRQEGA